jgi:hypothetical protein
MNDLRTQQQQSLPKTSVLCIPHVFKDISADKVSKSFKRENLGEVVEVCFISKISKKNESYNTANIKIKWYENSITVAARQQLAEGREIQVPYKGPWYWNVYNYDSKQVSKKPSNAEANAEAAEALLTSMTQLAISATSKLSVSAASFTPSSARGLKNAPTASKLSVVSPIFIPSAALSRARAEEDERRCKALRKGVILTEAICPETGKMITKEIEIDYGDMPLPPKRPILRRQHT